MDLSGPIPLGLTFDDVLLLPAESSVVPSEVATQTRLSRRITLDAAISHVVRDGTATAARETRGQAGLTFHL